MRYLPLSDDDRSAMLARVGVNSIDDLFVDVPGEAQLDGLVDLPTHLGEQEVERAFHKWAARNTAAGSVPFFVGAGAYRHHIPSSVDHIIQRGEFLTSYTPYQPEIAQGTLQYLFEFQTQVATLLGMEVANASLYDGSTACGEAVLMARRVTRRNKCLISGNLHPHYREAALTLTHFTADEITVMTAEPAAPGDGIEALMEAIDEDTASVVVQFPDVFGHAQDLRDLAARAHEKGALLIVVVTEIMAMGALMSPSEMGADIVVAEGQSIGNGLNFGGPYLGLFAVRQKHLRQMPGRIVGQTVDDEGRRGFVLTLSTREQHIRREKATSNICTNSGLCALAFTVHMTLLGEAGLRRVAQINHAKAVKLKAALEAIDGVDCLNRAYFNEITVQLPKSAAPLVDHLAEQGILAGVPAGRLYGDAPGLDNLLILAATETVEDEHIEALCTALEGALA